MKEADVKLYFRMALTGVMAVCALYVIVKGAGPSQNWASATLGSILTYWLKQQ